jgi:uncharacterized protein (TIGR03435 family)
MKRDPNNIDDFLERHLPSASEEEMESDGRRVLAALRSRAFEVPLHSLSGGPGAKNSGLRWRSAAVVSAAAALLLTIFLGTAVVLRQDGSVAVVENVDSGLYRVSEGQQPEPVSVRERLQVGDTVRTADGQSALFSLVDGSSIEMRSGSELSLERADDGVRVVLIRGGVIVNAAKQRQGHLYVQTKDVTVSVVGTVFLVNAEEEGSRVAVIEGEVRVVQGEIEKSLRPGQQVLTQPVMQWQPVSEEISWSGSRETHLALLQQATRATAFAEPKERFDVVSIRPVAGSAGVGGRGQGGDPNANRGRVGDQPCSYASEPRIDPIRLEALNTTAVQLIAWAYGLRCVAFSPNRGPDFLFGGPDWARHDGYHVVATRPAGPSDYTTVALDRSRRGEVAGPKLQRMLQTMLAERFKLEMHREFKETPVYVLSVLPGGPKFTAVMGPPIMVDKGGNPVDKPQVVNGVPQEVRRMPNPNTPRPEFSIWQEGDTRDIDSLGATEIHLRHRTMPDFIKSLSFIVGRPVLDRTNLTGDYNFFFQFRAVECATCPFTTETGAASRALTGDPGPTDSLFDLLKRVGLELKSARENVEVWVIDRVEMPTEN